MPLQEMLPYILLGIAVLLLIIAFIVFGRRSTTVHGQTKGDVLDEGAQRAQRNQALIDAPKSVAQDIGVTSANANSDKVAAAGATADAEAGAAVQPTATKVVDTERVPTPTPAPTPAPNPAPTQPAASAPVAAGDADDLRRIKGVGPKLVSMLAEQGVTRFDQIAAWTDADVARVDATLGRFAGRIERDQWVEQAKLLAAGDSAGFSERFGQNQ